jgi:hypothetical protein
VDPNGAPVANIRVRENWQHYSIETLGHEADARSDADGYTSFPARSVSASRLRRRVYPIWNAVTGGVHASFGPSAMVQAWDDEYEGWVTYKGEAQLPDLLVLQKRLWPDMTHVSGAPATADGER